MSKINLEELKQAREDFFHGTGHPETIVREDVLYSWKRSRAFHLTAEKARESVLSSQELQAMIAADQPLYDITTSFMEYLYQFVKGSGFMILFSNRDGYVLKIVGDDDIVKAAREKDIPLIPGCCRTESVLGTNAIGTPLFTGKPIQLYSYEHYFEFNTDWTCSGAPIMSRGKPVGCICISGPWNQVHKHTLGLAMAAAEAISRQLNLLEAYDALSDLKTQLQTAIDSIHSGVFLVDEDYRVSLINAITLNTLEYSDEEILGHPYTEFFPALDLSSAGENVYDIETPVTGKNDTINCFVSIKHVRPSASGGREYHLISFRKAESMQKLANRIMGSDARYTFDNIIGECPALQRIKSLAKKVAMGNTSVLITGESGTGKELFAQSIHNSSPYANGPFVAINCGAIPKDLIESELFGYESGAFTGARKEGRPGKFELANNGTIFLDEIGDMPYDVQVRLLRVLQEKCVTRIGGKKSIRLNLRVIAATNANLEEAIENHTFRSDLYYRLNVFSLHIPPLRERGEDVFLLSDYFLQKYQNPEYVPITGMAPEVREVFRAYPWPGNIRELENIIERICILTPDGYVTPEMLPMNMQKLVKKLSLEHPSPDNTPAPGTVSDIPGTDTSRKTDTSATGPEKIMTASETEKNLILEHLVRNHGNIKKTSESLGMNRRTLYRKLQKYHINPDQIRYMDSMDL